MRSPGLESSLLVCADWSKDPRRRAIYVADVTERGVRRAAPKGSWTVEAALDLAEGASGPAVLGFDCPLGVPESYWRLVRTGGAWRACATFAEWIRREPALGKAETVGEWAVERPFFSIPAGAGARGRWEVALRGRGVELLRKVDAKTGAKPVFVVSGIPGCVGAAARDVWAGLGRANGEGRRFSIWPFEPAGDRVTVAEIYPRAAYALALSEEPPDRRPPLVIGKTNAAARAEAVRRLREAAWVPALGVTLEDTDAAIRSEDDFDALVAAAGLLRCVLEKTPLAGGQLEDPVAEGAILGTGGINLGLRWRGFRTSLDRSAAYDPVHDEGATMPTKVAEAAAAARRATEEDLLATPRDGWKYELVDGQIVMSPAGAKHGEVCVRLVVRLGSFVEERKLGKVFDSSTGFRMPGGNVRCPDVSFVAAGRFEGERSPEGFSDLVPDLAVEVLSPDDRPRQVLDRIGEYLQAGVRLVWVIDPKAARAVVYRSVTDVRELQATDSLDGEDVLPGFRCGLGEIVK